MALIDNLISYWKFDESSGNAEDAHGTNDLTNNNATAFATGKINNGADLERSSAQSFSIADASQSGLDFSDALTFSMWVKFESALGREYYIAKRLGAGNQRSYLWYQADANSMNFDWQSNGTTGTGVAVSWSPSTSTWYHIVVTKTGTSVKFYVNGSQQGTTQTGAFSTIFNGTTKFEIGQWTEDAASNRSFDGFIDEVGVWNRALDASEIAQLYNSGSGLAYPFSGGSSGPSNLKTRDTIAKASIKTIDGVAIASVKTVDTIG